MLWAKTTCGPLATRQQSPSGAHSTSKGRSLAQCVKFLERAKKRLAVAETELQSAVQKKSQCEQEVAEGEADLARMMEEVPVPADPDEDANIEVERLKATLVQLESIHGRPPRGWVEAADNIRSKVGKRPVGCCAEDVLPSTEQDLGCWLDDKQAEDTESATTITGLISRGLAKLASFSVPPSVVWFLDMDTQALCRDCGQEEVEFDLDPEVVT